MLTEFVVSLEKKERKKSAAASETRLIHLLAAAARRTVERPPARIKHDRFATNLNKISLANY